MTNAEKAAKLNEMLNKGMVKLAIVPVRDGVDVPEQFRQETQLLINISYRFRDPLFVDAWGVKQVLSFNGVNYPVRVPWSAIYGMVNCKEDSHPVLFSDTLPGTHDIEKRNNPPKKQKGGLRLLN